MSAGDGETARASCPDSGRRRDGRPSLPEGEIRVTRGIVSGTNRILPETPFSLLEPLIQTDAPINPGNSGGPLVNRFKDLVKTPLVDGLLIEVIAPGSPAETAGLRGGRLDLDLQGRAYLLGGDIVVSINGRVVDTEDALADAMRLLRVGAHVTMRVFRDGHYRDVEYSLPERPLLPGDVSSERSRTLVVPSGDRAGGTGGRARRSCVFPRARQP
jgi:S1-C subfamily serine protease